MKDLETLWIYLAEEGQGSKKVDGCEWLGRGLVWWSRK